MDLAIDFERSMRYDSNFQNRIVKEHSGSVAMDQEEAFMPTRFLLVSVECHGTIWAHGECGSSLLIRIIGSAFYYTKRTV